MARQLNEEEQMNHWLQEAYQKALRNGATDPRHLNVVHDQVIEQVIHTAFEKVKREKGSPPSPFVFFLMGSAGREEPTVGSDQDHGIIHQASSHQGRDYFLHLGGVIAEGLEEAGYPLCSGKVMSSNPLWCQSVEEWKEQVHSWIDQNRWNDYRHLLILMDGRPLFGVDGLLTEVRAEVFKHIRRSPQVLYRMMENTKHIKKPLGVFGQFLIKTHGPYSGCIHVKESGILLYVNAVRLLAMQECIEVTPTLSRLDALAEASADHRFWNPFREGFLLLWQYRMQLASAQEGEGVHYIDIGELDHHQKRELKQALKNGMKLHRFAQHRIEKEGKGSRRK